MPEKDSVIKVKDIDDELYLLVERDFPMLQKDVEEIKKTVKLIEKSSENDRAATKEVSSQLVKVTEDVKSVAEDLKSLAVSVSTIQKGPREDKPEIPWWQDFRNILILLLVAGFMALAGVKAAESLILKISPMSLTEQVPTQQQENL